MIRLGLGLVLGLVLAFLAVNQLPERLPSWLGGRHDVL